MRGIERFFVILLLIGGLAGAAAFAHRAATPVDQSFAAPFARPTSRGASSSSTLRVQPLPRRPPTHTPAPPPLRLVAPSRHFDPAPKLFVPAAVPAHAAQQAPEPVVPVAPPAPAPAPTPAPAPPAAPPAPTAPPAPPAAPAPAAGVPTAPPLATTTPTAHGKGKGKGKDKGRGKDKGNDEDNGQNEDVLVEVAPVAETVEPVTTTMTTDVVTAAVQAPAGDKHGRGHDKGK